ncbi:hypothetical protein CPB83DRAFT_448678 [Crepidotus variabilis]|uniref:Uncharacterized protein n=1 Tax=Crepidotus variabilis TaxID=179855 RepID=A0A9P6ECP3_9AGAR|nr:hypothetical protein CPB83DRAFT_448678 [Crepidotus variabilis]
MKHNFFHAHSNSRTSGGLNGALNGNLGVIKSMMAEMTDSTNISKAYACLTIVWTTGSTLGPIIGGLLARPADRFPNIFGNSEFMRKYPYFLPCLIPATFLSRAHTFQFLIRSFLCHCDRPFSHSKTAQNGWVRDKQPSASLRGSSHFSSSPACSLLFRRSCCSQ